LTALIIAKSSRRSVSKLNKDGDVQATSLFPLLNIVPSALNVLCCVPLHSKTSFDQVSLQSQAVAVTPLSFYKGPTTSDLTFTQVGHNVKKTSIISNTIVMQKNIIDLYLLQPIAEGELG
jgi:hypothetical protein